MYMKPKKPKIKQECCFIAETVHTCNQPMVRTYPKASKLAMRMRKLASPPKHRGSYRPKALFEDLLCSDEEISANEKVGNLPEDKNFNRLWAIVEQDKENQKKTWRNGVAGPKPVASPTKSRELGSMPVPSKKRSSSPSPDPPCKKALNYDHPILNSPSPKNMLFSQKSPQLLQDQKLSNSSLQKSPFTESLGSLSLNGSQRSPSTKAVHRSSLLGSGLVTPSVSITPRLPEANGASPCSNGSSPQQGNGASPQANGSPAANGSASTCSTPSPAANRPSSKMSVSPSTPLSSLSAGRRQRSFLAFHDKEETVKVPSKYSEQRMMKALNIKPSMVGKGRRVEDRIRSSKLIHDVTLPGKASKRTPMSVEEPQVDQAAVPDDASPEPKTQHTQKLPDTTSFSPDSTTTAFLVEDDEIVSGPLATREETIVLSQEEGEIEERREPHMIGFPNPGNLCWMNSVVQCVVSLTPLMGDIQEHMANNTEPVKYSNVLRCLLKILSLRQQGQVARVNDTLRKFHKSLEAVKQVFATDTQQDCPEFLTELFDHLRDEFFRVARNCAKGAMLREISDNAPDDTATQRDSIPNPIRDNTEITMKQQKKCVSCSEVVVGEIREPILIVDVPTIPKCSLQHALKGYFKSADIERQCDSCSARTSTTTTAISRLPRVLTVQLKRYICKERTPESTFPGIEKVNSRVRIPEWLSVQDLVCGDVHLPSVRVTYTAPPINVFLDESSNQEDRELEEAKLLSLADDEAEAEQIRQALAASMMDAPRSLPGSVNNTPIKDPATPVKEDETNQTRDYRLVAFIQHMGSNPNSGHYTATVYNIGLSCWMNYNDADVHSQTFEVATGDRAQKNGYIFFYLHRTQFDALVAAAENGESG